MAQWPFYAWVKGNNTPSGRAATYKHEIEAHVTGKINPNGSHPEAVVIARFEHGQEMVRISLRFCDVFDVNYEQVIYDGPLDIFSESDKLQP